MGVLSPFFFDQIAAPAADGMVRIIANFAAGDVGHTLIQQRRQHADDACLGLTAQSEQNEIVPRQNGVHHLRNHGVFVADHAREKLFASLQFADQVRSQFIFHAAPGDTFFGIIAGFKSAEGSG